MGLYSGENSVSRVRAGVKRNVVASRYYKERVKIGVVDLWVLFFLGAAGGEPNSVFARGRGVGPWGLEGGGRGRTNPLDGREGDNVDGAWWIARYRHYVKSGKGRIGD
jgi:hypothetical protein